ncbi:MAG: RnfABCDGE type electron transport complex subunit G [Bacteroidales bacterium]|nr:RnfABCDGE type electron transport complex subunit G [Bacteroidales bacterium]
MAAKSNLTNMVLVLGTTCLLCSAVLGGAYALTKEPIEAAAAAKTQQAIAQVLPHFTNVEYSEEGHYYKTTDGDALVGYAIESTVVGFGGNLSMLVGVTPDGVVYNTSVLSHSETPGLGAKCTTDGKFMDQWRGFDPSVKKLSVRKDGGDVDAITASTITSRAYALAVENALKAFAGIAGNDETVMPDDDRASNVGGQDNE